jgi:pimeloyl-ACP methyl ester carboxylesterase
MSVVILQDDIVHYEVLGRGKPLIFVHGWIGSWRYWIPTMQAASISFRTYAVDLWGFGDSAKTPENYTLERQINLLNLFMQEMGMLKVALIGHGLGAVVSMLFTQRYASQVDRLMVICLPDSRQTLHPRLSSSSPAELADWLLNRTPDSEAIIREAPKTDQKAIQYSLANLQGSGLGAATQSLVTPCLMVYGQSDPILGTTEDLDLTVEYPENTHQIIFEQSGHFPMLDEQTKFNRLLADFLTLSPGASPRQLQLKEEWKRRVR